MQKSFLFFFLSSLSSPLLARADLIDYQELSHEIRLMQFRSGNHDPDGIGEYDVRVDFFILVNSEDERKKEFKDREKTSFEGGFLGQLALANLSFWKPEDSEKQNFKLRIDGDSIRSKLSEAMQRVGKKESELNFAVKLTLVERNVKYWFFGEEDTDLLSTVYYPIPPTKYDTPLRVNQELIMKDDNGTLVELHVVYDKPVEKMKKSISSAE